MAMNRETRRLLQKQGELGADGAPAAKSRRAPTQQGRPKERRTSPGEFVGEVRGELRKVVWPTRSELINFSVVVFITIVVITAIVAGFDWLTGESVLRLYQT